MARTSSVHFFEEGSPLRFRVSELPNIHVNVEDTVGSKTQIRSFGFDQAPHEQPGCGKKNKGDSDLDRHGEAADPMGNVS